MKKRQPNNFFNSKPKLGHPMSKFAQRVCRIVSNIQKGKTMTYKQVAAKAGNPNAARAVGLFMSKNFNPQIPCHRVICSDGRVGGYNRGGVSKKSALLKMEGAL